MSHKYNNSINDLDEIDEVFTLDDLNTIINGIGNEIFHIIEGENGEISKFEKLLIKDSLAKFKLRFENVFIERGIHKGKLLSEILDENT